MRAFHVFWLSLFAISWLGCTTTPSTPMARAWEDAEVECEDPRDDQCVSLLCLGDACGFYPCEGLPGEIELARFPPARPPAAAAAPGMGPRRNWGAGQDLPRGAVMVFPNWNGAPERIIPPSHQLAPGRWEKHHIFPQQQVLREWFERQGVKIHNYTMPMPRDQHHRLHSGAQGMPGGQWNQAWLEFKDANPLASPAEIFQHAGKLIHRFEVIGGPIQPYYSRPGA